jgi:hypothetical protein
MLTKALAGTVLVGVELALGGAQHALVAIVSNGSAVAHPRAVHGRVGCVAVARHIAYAAVVRRGVAVAYALAILVAVG